MTLKSPDPYGFHVIYLPKFEIQSIMGTCIGSQFYLSLPGYANIWGTLAKIPVKSWYYERLWSKLRSFMSFDSATIILKFTERAHGLQTYCFSAITALGELIV